MGRKPAKKRGAPGVTHQRVDPDGVDVWRIRVYGTTNPKTGHVRPDMQRYVRGTLAEAMAARVELRRELEADPADVATPPAFGEYTEFWLERNAVRHRLSTLKSEGQALIRASEVLGDYLMDRIRRPDLDALVTHLAGRGLAASTINMTVQLAMSVVRDWWDDIGRPCPVRPPKPLKVPERTRKATLSAAEVQRLLEAAAAPERPRWVRPILLLMLSTGCRIGEATGLRWDDIDEAAGVIIIRRTVSENTGRVNKPKSGRTRRAPLHDAVRQALRTWRRHLLAEQAPGLDQGWVFPAPRGRVTRRLPRSAATVRLQLDHAAEAAGLERVLPHDLRRTHVDAARRASTDPIVTRSLVGHADDAQRERYSSVEDAERAAGVSRVMEQFGHGSEDRCTTGHETGHGDGDGEAADPPTR